MKDADETTYVHFSPGTVGKYIVADIIRSGDIQPYLDAGLSRDWVRQTNVFEDTTRAAYTFVLDHFEKHGVVPAKDLFRRNFPAQTYRFPVDTYQRSELLEVLQKAVAGTSFHVFMTAAMDLYDEENLDDFATLDAAWSTYVATRVHAPGTGSGTSWEPIDIKAWLTGDQKPLEAELGMRDDGVFLLYPGKTHSLVGESEAGKSWVALLFVKQEIEHGNHVYYLDFEDSLDGVGGRLVELVDDATMIARYFHYIRPEGPLTNPAALVELVSDGSLVVVDGITEAMAMNPPKRQSNDWNANFAEFQGLLLNPLAAAGPAVLSIDHPVKSDASARHASGAGHKLRGLSGASYVLVNQEPFGRGRRGLSRVLVAKDRHGYVRTHGCWDKKVAMTHIANLVIDNTDAEHAPEVYLEAANEFGDWHPTTLMQRASEVLEKSETPLTKSALAKLVTGNKQAVMQAIDILIREEFFSIVEKGSRKYLRSSKPYTAPATGFNYPPLNEEPSIPVRNRPNRT